MKDERIQATVNRFAAVGFWIWYLLLAMLLLYRGPIVKQHPREFWGIFAIFCIGTLLVFIAYASKGVFDHVFKRWLPICIGAFIGVFAV